MKEIFKISSKLFLRLLVVNIMGFFIVVSFNVIFTGIFTENIGYKAYGVTEENPQSVELYEYYYSDGEDVKFAEFEQQGYKITKANIRSLLSGGDRIAFLLVSQAINLVLLITIIYGNVWQMANNDSNMIRYKHKEEDKLKGLKIGALAVSPYILLLLVLSFTKFNVGLFKVINSAFYGFIDLICSNALTFDNLSIFKIILIFLMLLIVPIVTHIIYMLGYKDISIGDKILYNHYKKKK